VYTGPVHYPTEIALTIVSSDGPAVTHIVGDTSGSVVTLDAGNDTDHQILDGFTIRDNVSPSPLEPGGVLVSQPTWGTIRNCIVRNNVSFANIAGVDYRGSRGVIANNWIVGNRVNNVGQRAVAGLFISGNSSVEVVNNTIARNRTASSTGLETSGIRIGSFAAQSSDQAGSEKLFSHPVTRAEASSVISSLDNNIIAFNGPATAYFSNSPPDPSTLFYNNIYFGNGNNNDPGTAPFDAVSLIESDPQFLDTANGNYHLTCTSPALNNGRASSVPTDITRDIDGQARFGPGIQPVDIGADEYQTPAPPDYTHTVLEATCERLVAEFAAIDDPGYADYTWYFGDSDTAVGNPVEHEYLNSGLYSVQLRVNTVCGLDSIIKPGLIQVTGPFTANFDADVRSGCDSIDVEFTGTTTAPVDTFVWDFGDNSPRDTIVVNGTEASVTHHYVKIGKCTVTLFAINECRTDTIIKADFIDIRRAPNVFITSSYDTATSPVCNPYTVEFAFTSTESLTAVLWEFGDGTRSTEFSPTHTYEDGGRAYDVQLTATGECGTDIVLRDNYIVLDKRPTATLSADATILCAGTSTVTLTATIDAAISSSLWQFGDGGSAPGQTAEHAYDVPGEYIPRFIMTHQCGTDTVQLGDTVSVGLPPEADLSATPISGFEPLEVTFTDQSANAPTAWLWEFGDGDTSDVSDPVHTYDGPGIFTVRLGISNPCGSDTATLSQPITVGGFELTIDSTGVNGDSILYSVDVDSSVLPYDNVVNLDAALTSTPRRGSMTFSFDQSSGIPPFSTTLHAIPTRDLATESYTIELTADDPVRITKTATQPLAFDGMQLLSISVDTLYMDSTIVTTGSSKTITLRNNAPALSGLRVLVDAPRISGSSLFTIQGNGQSLVPQQELRWDVLFQPRVKGMFSAALRVLSDDPARPEIVIPVFGRGIGEQSPPRLASSTQGELRIDQPINFEFSEPIIPDFSDTFLTVRSGAGTVVDGQREWTSNRALRFTADEFLPPDDTLSVRLRAVLTDTNGNYFDGNGNGIEERSPIDDAELSIPTGPGVYPGDADNDGVVNEGDVLALGRFYRLSGKPRPAGPPGFTLQPATAWDIREATYADADGSGDVDSMDICTISEFFDREVPLSKTVVEAWLNEAQAWSGDIVGALRSALADCPNSGPGQEVLQRFLDDLGGGTPLPVSFSLNQNYPNPFNASTLIRYDLTAEADVRLEIFDITGRRVRLLHHGHREAGTHNAVWDGRDEQGRVVASGIYFYRLTTPYFQQARKMVVLK
ncbi:MAG: PKD domain-containing protein, partial [candidate division Zixibacteria bacterium]|nr:PKD domain-containing protein [candidate division Zixibacteria bacterium]